MAESLKARIEKETEEFKKDQEIYTKDTTDVGVIGFGI